MPITLREAELRISCGHQRGAGTLLQGLEDDSILCLDDREDVEKFLWAVSRQLGLNLTGVDAECEDAVLVVDSLVQPHAEQDGRGLACSYMRALAGRLPEYAGSLEPLLGHPMRHKKAFEELNS